MAHLLNNNKILFIALAAVISIAESSRPANADMASPTPSNAPSNAPIACPTLPKDPQPSPIPTFQVANNVKGRALVSGSIPGSMADKNSMVGGYALTQGQTTYVPVFLLPSPVPSGVPISCPMPVWSPKFTGLAIPPGADKLALVTVYGTQDSFNNVAFSLSDKNGAPSSGITLSDTIPTSVLPPLIAQAPAITAPFGWSQKYFTLRIPAGKPTTEFFTYRTPSNGTIAFTIQTEVVGEAATALMTSASKTLFRPRLSFKSPAQGVEAGKCSPALTVQTVDGDGVQTAVTAAYGPSPAMVINNAKILLSGSPADIFLDDKCIYPTTSMGIANPVPPVTNTLRPAATASSSEVTFYFRSDQAESFPVTAGYLDTDNQQIFQVTQVQNIHSKSPISMEVSGPSSVNQNACSAPIKIRLFDQYNNGAPVIGATRIFTLSSGGSATFYADPACASPAFTSISFTAGESEKLIYVKDTAPELLKFAIADTAPLGSAIQSGSASIHVLATGSVAGATNAVAAKNLAVRLYDRLVGVPIGLDDPNLSAMSNLIMKGKILDAAHIASAQDGFYNVTIRNVATPLSNRLYNPIEPFNDFVATWMGIVRDDRDARELLTGNHIYVGSALKTSDDQHCANSTVYKSNQHYADLAASFTNFRKELVPVKQCAYNTSNFSSDYPVLLNDSAGLLTTRSWATNQLYAGTNRRAIAYALEVFMCKNIHDVADNSMPDWHIRRDVDRAPGGDPKVYTASCRSCHGGMDALGGAFGFFDSYPNNNDMNDFRMFYINKGGYGPSAVMDKVNKNQTVFPPGWTTGDDSWINFFIGNQNQALGWSTEFPMKGNGVNALGQMFANSAAFPACMAKRAFKEVCKRDPAADEAAILSDLSQDFQVSGYNMRRLFEKAASLTVCLGSGE